MDKRVFRRSIVSLLLCILALPAVCAQQKGAPEKGPPSSSFSVNAESQINPESARLLHLLREHPELTDLLKSYLAQHMTAEGVETSAENITTAMLYERIAHDQKFAKDASQALMLLAEATTQSLQAPMSPLEPSASAEISKPITSPRSIAATSTENKATAETRNEIPVPTAGRQLPADGDLPSGTTSASVPGSTTVSSGYMETASLKLSSLPKYLLEDQKAFWTLPSRLNVSSLSFLVPATFGTAALVGSDTAIEGHLPTSSNVVKMAANGSTAGALGLVGIGGGMYLLGKTNHNEHQRETGFLVGEAAIDAYATSTAFQYVTQRERPFTGNNKGTFFYGGNSFPSNTAAVAWASASVIAHEYPGFLSKVLLYGAASGVSIGRVIGEKHWTSDAVVGSALGWYMGRQIYRARSQGAEIDAKTWGTFEKLPEETSRNPAYMGTTFVPLDSWIYPVFDRLAALGYTPTAILAIRPWARLDCARLVLEAEEQLRSGDQESTRVSGDVKQLRQEFALELAELEGAANVGVQLESAYVRGTEIAGRPLRDSYDFAQTLYDDFGRPYGQGFNAITGVSARAEAGPLAFYFRGEFQHGSSLPNYTPAQQQAIVQANLTPYLPLSSVPTFNETSQFRPIEAYAALNLANWQVSFGYQTYFWGPDRGTSLMFSNNAPTEPMLKFGRIVPFRLPGPFAWLGEIRNTAFVGALTSYHWLRGPYAQGFPVYGNPYRNINPLPYTWGDKLALKMTDNFEIGVTLSTIWAGYGRPATLATWIHTFNTNGNSQRLDPGKRYTGFNASYRLPKLRNWVTFYVDGMANDEPNPIAYPRDSAFDSGLYFAQLPKLRKLDLRVEGIYTNIPDYPGLGPYYANTRYAQGYTNYWQIIGSWLGRQGDAIQAWSTYWFSPRNKLQLAYRRQWVDPVFLGGGGLNDFSTSIDWLFKHDVQISSTVQYERWNFPLLSSVPKNNVSASLQVMLWPTHGTTSGKFGWVAQH